MDLEIDLNKTVDENASSYFELSKKARKKQEGAKKALAESQRKLAEMQSAESKFLEEEEKKQREKQLQAERKKEWYEKFHWFFSSEDFLCVGGRDATSNEIIIKKHLEPGDLVFHTEAPGSPFFLVKDGQKAGEETLNETAQAVAIYSKAWKLGLGSADVFSVLPEQVSKEAKAGEYIAHGSFMVYGQKKFFHPKLESAIGLVGGRIIGGPVAAVKKQTAKLAVIVPGKESKSALAKKIKPQFGGGDLDEIIRFLPGEASFKK
jgi:predicted ribosome quality control (RQC) complex YloA/Tae2 family protein